MQTVILTEAQKKRILFYSSQVIESGHWGDGDVILPEEQILLDSLKSDSKEIKITDHQLRILYNWITTTVSTRTVIMGEDENVLEVLIKVLFKKFNTNFERLKKSSQEINQIIFDLTDDADKLISLMKLTKKEFPEINRTIQKVKNLLEAMKEQQKILSEPTFI